MKKLLFGGGLAVFVFALGVNFVFADVNAVTPSTNDINRTNGWAHVDQLSQSVGTTDLNFISTRNFYSCFEYRTDGDTSQVLAENGGVNYNTNVTDGLYPYTCRKNNSTIKTIPANEYVEVRMVFGAETDERFDWTRFDVLQPPTPQFTDDCKNDGWKNFVDADGNPFKNQGSCVSYVAKRFMTFNADDSLYYNGSTNEASLYGTGAIRFTWDKKTGEVISGYYNEIVPPTSGTTYYNVVTNGTVSSTGVVNLTFNRTNPNNYGPFSFTGTLSGDTLTGTLDGPYLFTTTGLVKP